MKVLIAVVSLLLLFSGLIASELEDRLKDLAEENAREYIRPLVTAFGSNLNSGLYNTADVLNPSILRPVRFGFNFHMMLAMVPSSEKTFQGEVEGVSYESATVFGDKGAEHSGVKVLPDGFNVSLVPLFIPQFRFGLPAGNELSLRYLPPLEMGDYGDVTFWGVGLKHSIDQYIPLFPLHLAVQGAYQSLDVGDAIGITSIAVNAHASKRLLMWTLYGGLGYEKTTLTAKYQPIDTIGTDEIKFDIDGDNSFRMTAGFRYAIIPFVHLNVDYTLSNYQIVTAGLGMSF
jgi:opacity protein-like surface antigen